MGTLTITGPNSHHTQSVKYQLFDVIMLYFRCMDDFNSVDVVLCVGGVPQSTVSKCRLAELLSSATGELSISTDDGSTIKLTSFYIDTSNPFGLNKLVSFKYCQSSYAQIVPMGRVLIHGTHFGKYCLLFFNCFVE